MKFVILLTITTFILLFTRQSSAIVRTEEVNEWTKDNLGTYFNKYKILYDRSSDHKSLSEIAQSYKDAATANAKYFLGTNVDQILFGFTETLSKNTHLAKNDIDAFITDLKHQLRQLELKGQLSKERVKAVLDKAHHQAVKQKLLTEDQWQKAYHSVESHYQQPSWFQRVITGKSSIVDDGAAAFNHWMQSVMDHTAHIGGLTKEQAKDVGEQIRTSISNTDIHRLGDKAWLDNLSQSISKQTQLKKDQLEKIIDSINRDVHGYKIFGLEYTGQAKDHVKNWFERVKYGCEDVWYQIKSFFRSCQAHIERVFNLKQLRKPKVVAKEAAASVKSVASSLSSEWSSSSKSMAHSRTLHSALSKASGAAAYATNKVHDFDPSEIKDSFGHFWRKKEHDAYRKLGYTEAHIDWIQNYLEKTFKNQKTSVKGRTDEAAIAIKRYLDELKVQTPSQIDQNIHKLKRHLESWRTLVD
ncbi:hypothetical protein HMPREF1544_07844 [Mucor circinelloides 1006PhL]|uniref:Uncharacterized protein n=1 Tax=Mucor circinelloides f. circinelloides (strain 1006PhL) TaxID=1220926 RepID=S2J6Y2_MUCC1|nr:hypothetical protein HMPREF1544_07844 [Mucor circinelloides 1006PhL]